MDRRTPAPHSLAQLAGWAIAAQLGIAACFVEPAEPPTFRYSCEGNGDCDQDGHTCIDGLCQRACSAATASEDCPSSDGYVTCFNGTCASSCTPSDDACPAPQTCFELPAALLGGGYASDEPTGLCGVACDAEAQTGCPAGELCVEGFCVDLEDDTGGGTGT